MCNAHYEAWRLGRLNLPGEAPVAPRKSVGERFWSKVDKTGPCWTWTANKTPGGYGQFAVRHRVPVVAHRYSYTQLVGPIPDGLDLDHLCRNRACVNPEHLEPVSRLENLRRGVGLIAEQLSRDHCKYGHPYSPENTYMEGPRASKRRCRTCGRLRKARKRQMSGAAA